MGFHMNVAKPCYRSLWVYLPLSLSLWLAGLSLPVGSYAQSSVRHRAQRAQAEQIEPRTVAAPSVAIEPSAPVAPTDLEKLPAHLPTVAFKDGLVSIVAYNSTLRDILEMIREQTGASVDLPLELLKERVIVQLGPGPIGRVLDSLLAGSAYNYVMLASPTNREAPGKIVVFRKTNEDPENPARQRAAQHEVHGKETAVAKDTAESSADDSATASIVVQQDLSDSAAAIPDSQQSSANSAKTIERSALSAETVPRTPNVKTAREVLEDLYTRRRQSIEQQYKEGQRPQ